MIRLNYVVISLWLWLVYGYGGVCVNVCIFACMCPPLECEFYVGIQHEITNEKVIGGQGVQNLETCYSKLKRGRCPSCVPS